MNYIDLKLPYFPDPKTGRPLNGGLIYVGEPGTDPTIVANQKAVQLLTETGALVSVSQPITIGAGGVPLYNGGPVKLVITGNFSIAVHDKYGAQVYYVPNSLSTDFNKDGIDLNTAHRLDTNNPHGTTLAQINALPASHLTAYSHGDIALNSAHRTDTNNPHSVTAAQLGTISDKVSVGSLISPLVHIPFKRPEEFTGTTAALGAKFKGSAVFTRGSTATYIDPFDGTLKTAAANAPRIVRASDGDLGLLLEGQKSNTHVPSDARLVDMSSYTSNLSEGGAFGWFTNSVQYPGSLTSDAYSYKSITVNAGNSFCLSVFVQMDDGSKPVIATSSTDSSGDFVLVINAVPIFNTGSNYTITLVDPANDVYRVSVYRTTSASDPGDTHGVIKYVGNSGKGFKISGRQFETSKFATSYIPTTTTAVTRQEDGFYIDAPGNIIDGNTSSFTILVDYEPLSVDLPTTYASVFLAWDTTRWTMRVLDGGLFRVYRDFYGVNAGTVSAGQVSRLAMRYSKSTNLVTGFINGQKQGSYSPAAFSGTLMRIYLGASGTAYGIFKNFRIYDVALADDTLGIA